MKDFSSLAFFVGTSLQERIALEIISDLNHLPQFKIPTIISLNNYYKLDLRIDKLSVTHTFRDVITKPWYDRSLGLKLCELIPFIWQLIFISRRFKYFLFFVDTGILERVAIKILKQMGCRILVLQDGLKRKPKYRRQGSLTWFGGGGAHLYLLMGRKYLSMVKNGPVDIVGSPIYDNHVRPLPRGKKILFINQCFAKYGEMSEDDEFSFVSQIVKTASVYGPLELRLHPHNNPRRYLHLKSPQVEVSMQKPLSQSLENAGIVLTVNSTVILEALVMGRPVITLDWHPSPFEQPVRKVVTHCENENELRKLLSLWKGDKKNALFHPIEDAQQEVESFVAFSSHESSSRIIKSVEKFIISDPK
jgi:hypothetical protein